MRFLLVVAACALPSLALAQSTPQVDLNQLEVNSNASNSLVVGTGEMLAPGQFRASLAFAYENNPAVYFQDGRLVGDVLSNRFTLHLVAGWAPFDWLEFGADVPFIAAQDGVDLERYGLPIPGRTGIGNPIVTTRVGFFSQAKGAWVDVAAQLGAKLPLGSRGAWLSDEKVVLAPKLSFGRNFGWFRGGAEIGLRYQRDPGLRWFNNPANVVMLGAVLTSGAPDSIRLEISGQTTVSFTRQRGPIDLLGGVRVPLGMFDLFALAGPNFDQGDGKPSFRVLTGLSFGSGMSGGAAAAGGASAPGSPEGAAPGGSAPASPEPSPGTAPSPAPAPSFPGLPAVPPIAPGTIPSLPVPVPSGGSGSPSSP